MKTAYLTTLNIAFNPFSISAKVPRAFLSLLPPAAHKSMQIKTTVLPRDSTQSALLELGFKDGKRLKYTWSDKSRLEKPAKGEEKKKPVSLHDIVTEVERHARITSRKEDLAG